MNASDNPRPVRGPREGHGVVLISPPVVKACEPLLGIATLQSWLEAHGVPCHCIDANAEAQEWLLSADRIEAALADAPESPRTASARDAWPHLRPGVERLKSTLRSWHGYTDPGRYRTTVTSLNKVVQIASVAHDPRVTASLTDYLDERYCDMSSASVLEAARAPETNLFYPWFRDVLIPRVRALKPKVVGISFIFRNQLLCGAVLARMLKDALPDVHVTLGGELVSAWVDRLAETRLLELADSVIPYEGELPLLALAQGKPLSLVPNICRRDETGRVVKNPTAKVARLGELPPPGYDWAPWDLYFAPERTAPMVTARGCYWNRCTFCPEVVNPETTLRLARGAQLVADMDAVHERYGVTTFHFIDSAMPPRLLRTIAEHVIATGRPYSWYGFSRLEPHLFREGWAERLAAGGCRMLKLGLETASQRLLDAMDKRQDAGDVSRILRALRRAGVMVHAYLMFGTPLEERADAEATRRFVGDHADCIQFMNCSIMNLAKGSPMALDPPKHGITSVAPFEIEGHTLDLALYDNFEGLGWGRLGARRFLHREFLRDPRVRPIHLRTPAHFDANHAVFLHRLMIAEARATGS